MLNSDEQRKLAGMLGAVLEFNKPKEPVDFYLIGIIIAHVTRPKFPDFNFPLPMLVAGYMAGYAEATKTPEDTVAAFMAKLQGR